MIQRRLYNVLKSRFFTGKAIILIGPRQVGKSTLFKYIISQDEYPAVYLDCDDPETKSLLTSANMNELSLLIGNKKLIVIDEAQRIPEIGLTLKRITDNFSDVQLLVTGSSSLDLGDKLNESLTGRKYEYNLFPISTAEIYDTSGLIEVKQSLANRLVYGSYPDILNHTENACELLLNLTNSYLYKDILSLDNVRRPALLDKLLTALALQIGSEVSFNELAQTVGTDNKTVERYVNLLEKCYVIFQLTAFNRNLRTELKRGKKIYFYDTGVRNAILHNFSPLELRQDVGALWENFFIAERIKANHYALRHGKCYFWRTTAQQEIDYIEEADGEFITFEMKWNMKRRSTKIPKIFIETYPVKESNVVTPENYYNWLDLTP